jgi:glycosyltransferase involved in cell wall biosynthesis
MPRRRSLSPDSPESSGVGAQFGQAAGGAGVAKVRTLWLADHLLVDACGHHLSHAGYLADAAKRAGLGVRILCARKCSVRVAGNFRMDEIFRRDLRNSPSRLVSRSPLALDILETLSRRRFQSDLISGIRKEDIARNDIIFAQMLAPRNLTSWLQWLKSLPQQREPIVVLHFGYAPERFGADPRLPRLLSELESTGKLEQARFVADSPILQSRYEAILQQPVTLLPVVVSPRTTESSKPPGNPPCFAALGNAREDKGFPEVLAAIDSLCASNGLPNARFALQSSDPDHRSAAALADFRSTSSKQVSLVDHPLSDDAYLRLLREADVLLLPYRADTYKERSSGVFCEALSAGKPVIVSQGSFMGLQVSRERNGWLVRDRNPASLASTIRKALPELESVAARCLKLMHRYSEMFHPDSVVSKLLTIAEGTRR